MGMTGKILNGSIYTDRERATRVEGELKRSLSLETQERIDGDSQSFEKCVSRVDISQDPTTYALKFDYYNVNDELISSQSITLTNKDKIVAATYNQTLKTVTLTSRDGSTVVLDLNVLYSTISAIITAEAARAKQKETDIIAQIDTEIERAKAKEDELGLNVTTEKTRAMTKESQLDSAIQTETTARKSADDKISTSVTTEATARTAADTALSNRINQEVTDRTTADTAIVQKITDLNLTQVGSDGKYIQYVSQTAGKVGAIPASFDTTISSLSTNSNAPTSKAVYNFIASLDVASIGKDGSYIKTVSEADGKISATTQAFESTITKGSASTTNAPTADAVDKFIDTLTTDTVGDNTKYLTSIKEDSGKITTTAENKVTTIDASHKVSGGDNLTTESSVINYVDNSIAALDVPTVGTDLVSYITMIGEENGKLKDVVYEHRITSIDRSIPGSDRLISERATREYVDAETTRATEAETALNTNLNAEASRALSAEDSLNKAISTEVERASTVEDDLNTAINTETQNRISGDNSNELLINGEKTRATNAEEALKNRIIAIENNYLTNFDKTELETEITNETTARTNDVATLTAAVKAIADDYLTSSDKTELENKISTEQSRASGVEAGLDTRLTHVEDTYVDAAGKAELVQSISNEVTRATNVETELNNNLTSITAIVTTINSDYLKSADKTYLATQISQESATREATDNSLAASITTKLDKLTGDSKFDRAYVKLLGGEQSALNISSGTDADTIAKRTSAGELLVSLNDASPDSAAVNKGYIDYAHTTLSAKIDAETARAEAKEDELNTLITDKESALSSRITNLNTTVSTEIETRQSADTDLAAQIVTERTRATTAETTLDNSITAINNLIPNEATSSNQLADKDYVIGKVTSQTGKFWGTYESTADLPTSGVANGDYAIIHFAATTTSSEYYKLYKYSTASTPNWKEAYTLNTTAVIDNTVEAQIEKYITERLWSTDQIETLYNSL